jgi:hypothetical protein
MRLRLLSMLVGAILVIATFTFPLWQPLVRQEAAVQEIAFPGLALDLQDDFLSLPPEQQRAYLDLRDSEPGRALAMVSAALQPRRLAPEDDQDMPEMVAPITAATGTFLTLDPIRSARGTATIFQQADGSLLMRFEDFAMPNAPDARVILSPASEPQTSEEMHADDTAVEIGELRGSVGNQNYPLPNTVDLALVRSVVIYSAQLDVIYTYAPLFVRVG